MSADSVYFHIPYCAQACSYCDFHFSTVHKTMPAVLQQMGAEIVQRKAQFGPQDVALKSVYFGGGTPSVLALQAIAQLLAVLREHFEISPTAEITLEANPDDINPATLTQWKAMGINRLSLGIQSFHNAELTATNRAHNAEEALACIPLIKAAGFENYTVDLMYGMPGSTLESWQANLDLLTQYKVPHLSCYALTVERKTALYNSTLKGTANLPAEDVVLAQYHALCSWAAKEGMVHYELSNYAQPGFESRHNSMYWEGKTYIGIGPGAHGFDGVQRYWNVSNNSRYAKGEAEERESLTALDVLNERIMVRLRTAAGFRWEQDFHAAFQPYKGALQKAIEEQVQAGLLMQNAAGFWIPEEHWMVSDQIISNLFQEEAQA